MKKKKCSFCGKEYWDFGNVNGNLCLDCFQWLQLIQNPKPNMEVVAGVYYDFLPPYTGERLPGNFLGGGHMKYLLKKDGTTKKSNDIWKIGIVPLRFREKLQDTGWWISKGFFYKINKYRLICNNKGCYDRYHCFHYDIRQEYDNGPYNTIPRNWVVGNEKCPAFCNILDIEHYDRIDGIETI